MISGVKVIEQLLLIPFAYGLLVIRPKDTEVLLGNSTYFNCSTSIFTENIHWYHYAVGATALDKTEVCAFGKIYEPYLGRFNIDEPFNGAFNLLINSVQEEDAGRYDCQDDGGFGDISSAQLVVLVADPACRTTTIMDEVVGPNSCQLEPDKPELSCIVQYKGNIPPMMEWTSLKENVSDIQPNVAQEINAINVTYHLMLNVHLFISGFTYICQTTRSTSGQIGCSLDPIKILYAFESNFTTNASINEELICSANSSQPCSYRWKWFQDDDVNTVSKNASLKPTKPGWHKCEADCNIKKQSCTILVMYALVYQTPSEQHLLSNSDSDKVKTILLAVLLPISILFVSVIIGICFRMRKRNKPPDGFELETKTSLLHNETEHATEGSEMKVDAIEASDKTVTGAQNTTTEGIACGKDATDVNPVVHMIQESTSTEAKETVGETEPTIEGSETEIQLAEADGEAVTEADNVAIEGVANRNDATEVNPAAHVTQEKQQTEETSASRATLTEPAALETSGISFTDPVQLLNRHREFLEEHIDPDFGILDKLLASNSLTNKEIRDIKENKTVDKRNSRLLDSILQRNKCDQFIRTLSEAKQIHIVNYMLSDGEHKPEFGGEWPLTQQEVTTLNSNQEALVDILDTCDLTGRLFSCGIINARQRNFIASKQPAHEKNEALLDIIRRCSLNAYQKTIRCLYATNQSHIAKILEEGGVLARLDANLEGEGVDVSQAEAEVLEGINNLLGNRPLPVLSHIYELLKLSLAGVSQGHSISLYFHCLKLSDLERIQSIFENGRLKDIVEVVFNRFTSAAIKANFKSATDSFNKCREFFTGISPETSSLIAEALQQYIERLMEMIDPDSGILDQLQLNNTLSFREVSDIKEQHPFSKRNSLLLQHIKNKRKYDCLISALKETGQSHIANFLIANGEYISEKFGDDWPLTESELSVLDTNKEDLIDLIDPDELIELLYSKGVINRRQREAIFSKLTCYEKNEALLWILRRQSLRDFKATIRCLRKLSQSNVAEILEKGGDCEKSAKIRREDSFSSINDLPLELLDIILRKSCLVMFLEENQSHHLKDEDRMRRIASVEYCWFQRIKSRKFRKTVWSHLSRFYQRTRRIPAIYRTNRMYLDVEIRVLPKRLKSADFLTDVQAALVQRQRIPKSKNNFQNIFDFIHYARLFDITRHVLLIRCLREANQNLVTRIIRNGGVAVRAEIQRQKKKHGAASTQQIVDKSNNPSDSNQSTPSQLKDYNIEVLTSFQDRSAVIWMWCKSQSALIKLRELNKHSNFNEILQGFNFNTSKRVNIDNKFQIASGYFPKTATLNAETFQKHIEFLEENIDPDSGLLDELLSIKTLSSEEISYIKDQHPFYERNFLLLQCIVEKKNYEGFIDALGETCQSHIANFLIANGEYIPEEFGDDWPLTESELSVLDDNNEILIDLIEPDKLIEQLHSKRFINRRQKDAISSKAAYYQKNEALLDILRRQSLMDFKATIQCLHETNQSRIAQILKGGGETLKRRESRHEYFLKDSNDQKSGILTKAPNQKESSEIRVQDFHTFETLHDVEMTFTRHLEFMEENIDPDFGFLNKLISNTTLSFKETSNIKDQHPFYKRNSLLLDYIIEKKKYDCLINALREKKQTHIVNFLIAGGEYIPEKFGDDWPLRESELSILNVNQRVLLDLIDPDELVGRLYSRGVINRRQKEAISSKLTCHERNEALLEILRRRSLKDFNNTIRCLRETNQDHIAQILFLGGVVTKIHAEGLDDTTEDKIIDTFVNLLRNRSFEESRRILEEISQGLVSTHQNFLKKGIDPKSVIRAKSPDLKDSSEIRVQDLSTFDFLQNVEMAFEKHLEFLKEKIDSNSGLLDILLSNRTLNFKETSHIKDQLPFYKRNSLLLQYIKEKKKYDCLIDALRETEQIHIVNFLVGNGEYIREKFGDDWPLREPELSILDGNKEVLIDLIEPGDLVGLLDSKGVINGRQREAISSKMTYREKNEALLEILLRRSLKDFKLTIQCLHVSNQSHIAQLLEEGAVVVRVHAEGLDDRTEVEIIAHFTKLLSNKPLEESRRIIESTLNVIALKKGK